MSHFREKSSKVSHENAALLGDIRAACLSSIWTVEANGEGCILTHEIRYDAKGRSPAWYDKMCPSQLANDLTRIRDIYLIDSLG